MTKNILIIGCSSQGKSTLANVLTENNDFEESSGSVSKTKKVQVGEFTENDITYQVIDTPSLGGSNDEEALKEIKNTIQSEQVGGKIDYIFFAFRSQFSKEVVEFFDELKNFLTDDLKKNIILVRTNFENFCDKTACDEDEQELVNYENMNVREIFKNHPIIHVDNPAIPEIKENDNEKIKKRKTEKIEENTKTRTKSREVILNHLQKLEQKQTAAIEIK